ncbi:hypothetical protein Glove_168g178 [Diversispora epigaea]|uniref:Uncharacterized protein n=1 Tax=Diversispora epigaea TaxID=1348612 RepID=A0A397IT05_9GLOM|nr:hypothetical protein Glove_168g178 [Diversispora epigaea]
MSYQGNTPLADVDKYTLRVLEHFIFCLENQPEYFSQRSANESTFRVRFIEPIIELGEISSTSSATRRNFKLAKGKRQRIGLKTDGIGSLVSADDKELLIFELSRALTQLPVRRVDNNKSKLDEYMVDMLNNLLEDYKECEFELAKSSRYLVSDKRLSLCHLCGGNTMLGLQNELAMSLNIIQELKIAKARKHKVNDPVGSYMLRLPPS